MRRLITHARLLQRSACKRGGARKPKNGIQRDVFFAIWHADTWADAETAFDRFIATYEAKYPKATDCVAKDRTQLLALFDFPAAHWQHLGTTNPIESTSATVRLRAAATLNRVSAQTGLALMHQLAMSPRNAGAGYAASSNSPTSSPA